MQTCVSCFILATPSGWEGYYVALAPDLQQHTDIRPPLKWAGGKRWLVPHLRPYWARHYHRRPVEPFCINVPFGKYQRINYATTKHFEQYRDVYSQWKFICMDFEHLYVEPEDFIYADPPYDVEFTSYSKEDFGWDDQVRLAKWLAQHQGPVILSNQATDRIVELYRSAED